MNIGCPICRRSFVDANDCVATECGHLFDRECIARWMETHRRPAQCPTCRQTIRGLTRIYFTAIPDGSSARKSILQLELKVAQKEINCLKGRNLYLNQKYFNQFTQSKEMEYASDQMKEQIKKLQEENAKLHEELKNKDGISIEQQKSLESKVLFLKNQYTKNDKIKNKFIKFSKDLELRKNFYKKLAIGYRIKINDLCQEIEGLKTEIDYLDVHRAITNPFCEDATIAKLEQGFLNQAQDEIRKIGAGMDPFLIGKKMAHLVEQYRNKFVVDAKIAMKNLEPLHIKYGKHLTSSFYSNKSGLFKCLERPQLPRSSTRCDLTVASGFEDWSWEY